MKAIRPSARLADLKLKRCGQKRIIALTRSTQMSETANQLKRIRKKSLFGIVELLQAGDNAMGDTK
jgi:hypothetical protein